MPEAPARRRALRALFVSTVLATAAAVTGCGGAPEIARVELRLALDFNADALLEVFVLDGGSVTCTALVSGDVAPGDDGVVRHGERRTPANRINQGASAQVEFETLPAEVPLVFYARAIDGARAVLATACEEDVVIPNGGHADITLRITE